MFQAPALPSDGTASTVHVSASQPALTVIVTGLWIAASQMWAT